MLTESVQLAPPVFEQMNADIRHRLNLFQPHRSTKLASLPVNKRPLVLARNPTRFILKMDFDQSPKGSPDRVKFLLVKPLQVTLVAILILAVLFYTMSVSKFTFFRVAKFQFDSHRPLVVSAANCRVFLRPLNASESNTVEVRASFTRNALYESFETKFSSKMNSIYLWQPSSLEACQIVIGVDRLTSPLSLALNCLNECSIVTDMPERFEMGELLLKGRSIVVAMRNVTLQKMEFCGERFVGNPLNPRVRNKLIIASKISLTYQSTEPTAPEFTVYARKFAEVYPTGQKSEMPTTDPTNVKFQFPFSRDFRRRFLDFYEKLSKEKMFNRKMRYWGDQTLEGPTSNGPYEAVLMGESVFVSAWGIRGGEALPCSNSPILKPISESIFYPIVTVLERKRWLREPLRLVFVVTFHNFRGGDGRPVQALLFPNGSTGYLFEYAAIRWAFGGFFTFKYLAVDGLITCSEESFDVAKKIQLLKTQMDRTVQAIQSSSSALESRKFFQNFDYHFLNLPAEGWAK